MTRARRWAGVAVCMAAVGLSGCSDLIGPDDPRYEDQCVVYVHADASPPQIKTAIMEQLSGEQRARCRPPHVRRVSFG
ncbi:MAG: hypothetical protein AAF389_09010 [Gemmatimonadota bacterium]